MPTSLVEARRAPAWLALLLSLAACGSDGDGGAGNDSCYLFRVGSTCALTLAPFDVQEFFFQAPGAGQSLLTISLTGSTTYASWWLEGPFGGACDNFTYGVDQSCTVVVNGGASYHLWVYEGEGRRGTTNLTVAWQQSLGSPERPVPVSRDSLVSGSVGANGTSYFSFVVPGYGEHTIAVTGWFTQLTWDLFSDPRYVNRVRLCTATANAPDLACRVPLSPGQYYLKVQERSGAPQEFQLAIGSGALNEGAPGYPVPVDAAPRVSTVDVFGHSYYAFEPWFSGAYLIRLDAHEVQRGYFVYPFPGDYGWTLSSDPAHTAVVKECRDSRQVRYYPGEFEDCVASLTGGVTYYLRVDEQAGYPNRMYTVTVVHIPLLGGSGTSEGAIGAPVPFAGAPYGWGDVAALGSSYYSFQTGAAASAWRIVVTPDRDDVYPQGSNLAWSLFDDPGFSIEIMRCDRVGGVWPQSCLTPELAGSRTYYLRVDEKDGIPQSFAFNAREGFAPPTPSSPAAPVAIPIGAGGLDVIQDYVLSTGFYSFTTSQPGTYRITSNLATGDLFALVAWHLYDDAAFSHWVVRCFKPEAAKTSGTSCTVSLPGGTDFYLKVQAPAAPDIMGYNDLHLAVERLGP